MTCFRLDLRSRSALVRLHSALSFALGFLTLAVAAAPAPARAQDSAEVSDNNDGFALNRYDIAEAGSDWFAGDALDLRGEGRPGIRLGVDWAHKPLVRYDENGDELEVVIQDQVYGHAGLSLVLFDRLRLAANLPIMVSQAAQEVDINGVGFGAAEGGALGDLRLSLDVRLAGEYGDAAQLALGAAVHVPTGNQEAFTSDGKVRIVPRLMLAGDIGAFAYSLRVSFNYRPQNAGFGTVATGSEMGFVATAGIRFADGVVLLGPELWGSTVLQQGSVFAMESTPIELAFGIHLKLGGFLLGAGAGPGLNRGLGAPAVRVLGTIGYIPEAGDRDDDGILDEDDACPDIPGPENKDKKLHGCPDRDGDRIIDPEDACPDVAGEPNDDPTKHGCPPPGDRDGDGIFDEADACPDVPGVADPDPKKNGCPPDRDGDGIVDDEDACPDEPGPRNRDPEKNGCPLPKDRDGDTIIDDEDACPDQPGPRNEDPAKNGCPLAFVQDDQIKITERIEFEFDKARLVPSSTPVLEAVLEIMQQHPEITEILVEGHTDNKGKPAYNKKLSDKRAASVVKWLVEHGIDKARLKSRGVGMERPIASNDDDVGRQTNRRVEFHIEGEDASLKKEAPADDSGGDTDTETDEGTESDADEKPEKQPKKKKQADDDDPLGDL